jgi:CHAT domain-containing protein
MAANHLYQKLLFPFQDLIKDKKMTIVPDGKLSYITFEALLKDLPDTTSRIDFKNLSYLVRDHTVNYAYSARLLYNFPSHHRKAKAQVLAFAPEYKADTFFLENRKLTLVPLPGIQREVELISKEIKTELFRGNDASEAHFREHSSEYDILHLAMHAFINDSLPAFSRFAFAQEPKGDMPENDGWLNTADIYNLDLNARLTVLSACNTGSGSLQKGEGVMSLARGFLYAGCPTIIMTLWEVEDNAGTEIMSSFYKNLKRGIYTDEALRLAKLEYLESANPRMAHPHYWLGYVSIGQPAPLFRSYDFYFFGVLILALLAIGADQLLRRRKMRKERTD